MSEALPITRTPCPKCGAMDWFGPTYRRRFFGLFFMHEHLEYTCLRCCYRHPTPCVTKTEEETK